MLFLRSPKRRRQPRHRRKGLVQIFKISTSNRQYTVRWLVGVGDLINYLNDPMALVGVGDLIVLGKTLVEVGDLINYIIFCIFVDLVGLEDWKIPAVLPSLPCI